MIVLRLLLIILKIIGILLLCVLGLIFLISFIPVGATAEYSKEGPLVLAHAGPVTLQLIPKKKKSDAAEKQKKEKKKKKGKSESEDDEASDASETKKKQGGKLPMFRELIALAIKAQASLRNKLRIKNLVLHLTVGGSGEDPSKAAQLYGKAWAALGNLMPLLMQTFRIEKRDIRADIDFLSEETTIYAKATLVITIGAILRFGIYYGIRGFRIYRRHTKKGGMKHGTSSE